MGCKKLTGRIGDAEADREESWGSEVDVGTRAGEEGTEELWVAEDAVDEETWGFEEGACLASFLPKGQKRNNDLDSEKKERQSTTQ